MNKLSVAKVVYRILVVVGLLAFNLGNAEVALPAQAGTDTVIVRYAVPGGLTNGDCDTWSNACELQTALGMAADGEEVWARQGVYKPTSGTDRTATFQLKDGVAVYGGFAGTETARDQRQTNLYDDTLLSGDLLGDDSGFTNNGENSYHVVAGATGGTLDGFTITAGNANGSFPSSCGGGMFNDYNSSPAVTNVTFSGNSADYGGGMFNYIYSSPAVTNVTFSGNSAVNDGGGMFNAYYSSPALKNVILANSSGGDCVLSSDSTLNPASANNWIQDSEQACGLVNGVNGNIIGSDPLLGALGDYGGSTQTLPLLPGSPAIDAGDDTVSICDGDPVDNFDQRGVARPKGTHCDIGAVEMDLSNLYLPIILNAPPK